jgi:glycine oxidase
MAEPEILIIGAGVVGLTLAHELSRRGRQVHVITREAPGSGASATAAGMLEVHYPLTMPAVLRDFCVQSRALYPALAGALREESGIDIRIDECGSLALATSAEERREIEDAAAHLPGARLLRREAEWLALEPALAPGLAGALSLPDDHHVDPRRLCAALVLALERRGVPIRRGVTVGGLLTDRGRVVGAATDAGPIHARWTVNAAGAWAAHLGLPGNPPPVAPVKGQILVLSTPDLPRHVLQGHRIYLVPRPRDGHLLVGATVEDAGFDTTPTAGAIHDLLEEGMRMFPPLRAARHVETRVGLRPGTPDGLPLLGPGGADGLLLAAGLFRKGVLLAPAAARVVADFITTPDAAPAFPSFLPGRPHHAH